MTEYQGKDKWTSTAIQQAQIRPGEEPGVCSTLTAAADTLTSIEDAFVQMRYRLFGDPPQPKAQENNSLPRAPDDIQALGNDLGLRLAQLRAIAFAIVERLA